MSEVDAVLAVLWVGVTLYAIFGGADFGVGIWDLLAGGAEEGARERELIEHSIAPVWEANHTWLIFCLVVLWTGFPEAFAAVMSTMFVPLSLAGLGIVLRGAGFAFRKVTTRLVDRRLFGAIFAISSLLTPFFMGTVVGGIASGRVPAGGGGDRLTAWLNWTSVLVGLLFVATCAYLAAVLLVRDARQAGDEELAARVRAARARGRGCGRRAWRSAAWPCSATTRGRCTTGCWTRACRWCCSRAPAAGRLWPCCGAARRAAPGRWRPWRSRR